MHEQKKLVYIIHVLFNLHNFTLKMLTSIRSCLNYDFYCLCRHMLDQFVVSTTQHALSLDALESSHPIMANVKNPSEIEAIFDVISYKKVCLITKAV